MLSRNQAETLGGCGQDMEANHGKPSNHSSLIMSNKTLDDMLA